MRSTVRTYCLLVSLLFVTCLYPETGLNCMRAQVTDSIKEMGKVNGFLKEKSLLADSSLSTLSGTTVALLPDTAAKSTSADTTSVAIYKPDPKKAVWYSALCPGLGQLYNRRYWKLPLVGAGIVGIAYAIGWNGKYYNAYTNAYRDISDNDPNTKSYLDLLPKSISNYNEAQLTTVLKNRQQTYRRSRDLSIIGAVGVYLICLIDAYVDAQLYDFDISPDLSIVPQSCSPGFGGAKGLELSLAFQF